MLLPLQILASTLQAQNEACACQKQPYPAGVHITNNGDGQALRGIMGGEE